MCSCPALLRSPVWTSALHLAWLLWFHSQKIPHQLWLKNKSIDNVTCKGPCVSLRFLLTKTLCILSLLCKSMFEFLWNSKIDKVIHKTIYLSGSLKMVDINLSIRSLKCDWIKRLSACTSDSNKPWMLCATFDWKLPSGSGEEDENVKSLQTDWQMEEMVTSA